MRSRERDCHRASLEEPAGRQADLLLERNGEGAGAVVALLSGDGVDPMYYGASAVQIFLITTRGKCWFLWFVSNVKLG
jgi:hypothetical protein